MRGVTNFLCLPPDDLECVVDAVGARWERLRDQRILLTGATGFIGKWLLGTFLHANARHGLNARILLLSRRPGIFLNSFPELKTCTDIEWITGDVRELKPDAVGDCGYAIHAATDVVAASTPAEILDTCITGTRRVLEAMATEAAPRRVLLLSSGAVYGRIPSELGAVAEDWNGAPDPLLPGSAYGEGKRVSELLCCMSTAQQPALEVAIARCFAFVGPHLPLDKHFAIGNFIAAALRGEDIQIQGDGTPLRSYLYAADLAHWLWVLLFEGASGRAYNVGGAQALSISDLAFRVNSVLRGSGQVRIAQAPQPAKTPQAYLPCIQRMATEFGLAPATELDDAILRTARWASAQLKA